jgi:hypothetical protein
MGVGKISSLQRAIIGKTTERELSGFIKKELLPNGSIRYVFSSLSSARPNEIIVRNGVVIFERIIIPAKKGDLGYATISDFISKFGNPERAIRGSNFYGWAWTTYIYASRGFSFIANPNTDEVFEIQLYEPTKVDDYIEKYGQDINPNLGPAKEGY